MKKSEIGFGGVGASFGGSHGAFWIGPSNTFSGSEWGGVEICAVPAGLVSHKFRFTIEEAERLIELLSLQTKRIKEAEDDE